MRAILRFLLRWAFKPEETPKGYHLQQVEAELAAARQGHEQFAEVIRERAAEITKLHARIRELEGGE